MTTTPVDDDAQPSSAVKAHFRLLFTAPTADDSLAVKLANRAAVDAFLAELRMLALTGLDVHAPNPDPFVEMLGGGAAAAPGRLEPLEQATHEGYLLPKQSAVAEVAFQQV
jgi:hypothetical protein